MSIREALSSAEIAAGRARDFGLLNPRMAPCVIDMKRVVVIEAKK
jgi:hypothetical protein